MTALWASLIVLGLAMIIFAAWPTIRAKLGGKSASRSAAESAPAPGESDPRSF
jgi:hypothetical protein